MSRSSSNHSKSSPAVHRLHVALEKFSHAVTAWAGSTWAFATALAVIAIWAVTGPLFGFSDTWQLVINTGTTIVTFLMVFLIQRTQNKDALAIQVKLDELLAAQPGASNQLINVEDWSEDDISELHERFTVLSQRLKDVADAGGSHSIAETREIVEAAKELAGHAKGALEQVREKQLQ
jgi:low affinity Fe/Cu permease